MATALDHRFPCDRCGADMRFAPNQAQMSCAHCGAASAVPGRSFWDAPEREHDIHAHLDRLEHTAAVGIFALIALMAYGVTLL